MIRKGQARRVSNSSNSDVRRQNQVIDLLFELAADARQSSCSRAAPRSSFQSCTTSAQLSDGGKWLRR
jgi:hypothetical protein